MNPKNVLLFLLLCLASNPALSQTDDNIPFYYGADLSYVNEMEDCGGVYRENGEAVDPFELFAAHGTNLTRIRLWHSPDWTDYSTLPDVRKTIRRARNAGMQVLLDFHYSDEWADPSKQYIPAAWVDLDFKTLKDSLYQYTRNVLTQLSRDGLLPDMVQIGNEINPGMLLPYGSTEDWSRLGALLNAGIRAVREVESVAEKSIKVILHVAQPEHVFDWIEQAHTIGEVHDYDFIGLSYYSKWSEIPLDSLSYSIAQFREAFQKDVMVVETAYPWAPAGIDEANDILAADAVEPGYPATPEGQKNYLIALKQQIEQGGGTGIIYWEPAWISTACSTRWGKGSHWENATFFDYYNGNEVLPGIDYWRGNR